MDFLKEIYNKICKFFPMRYFVYRIDIYNGTEPANSIYDEDVYEYEFFNQGTSICIINGGLYLYPQYSGITPNRVRMVTNYNERDDSIYKYEFVPLDYQVIVRTVASPQTSFQLPVIVDAIAPDKAFNRLIVKSKVRAIARK